MRAVSATAEFDINGSESLTSTVEPVVGSDNWGAHSSLGRFRRSSFDD
jgi:hypothetical protein